jgi:hypothetical protein
MSSLLADKHFIPRSLEESFKKAMEIFVKTTKEMKRIGKGPETEAENNYLRMLSYDFATLFPQLCGL